MSEFNFIGESHFAGIDYKIYLSVNANDVVHLAKATTNSPDETTKNKIKKFCDFAEGRLVFQLEEFFTSEIEPDPFYYAWQRGMFEFTGERSILRNKVKHQAVICNCSGLTQIELEKIKTQSTFTMESLVKETKAGTGCGSCRADLKIIMKSFEEYPKLTATSYIRLWNTQEVSQAEFLCRCKKVPLQEIAEVLEKNSHTSADQLYLKLQTKFGVGLSCSDCISPIKTLLA